jgi:hypothetical protein
MDIKVNGKELLELSKEELFDVSKEVKLAQLKLQQKDLQQFNVGDKVRLNKQMGQVEGIIEDISSRSVIVNTGERKVMVSPKMMEKVS